MKLNAREKKMENRKRDSVGLEVDGGAYLRQLSRIRQN